MILAETTIAESQFALASEERKVLLACTDSALSQDLYFALTDHYCVDTTEEGWHALELLTKGEYFMAVLDAELPGKSGYIIAKELRRNAAGNSTSIMLISNNGEQAQQAKQSGICDEIMEPPFDTVALLQRLYRLCDRKTEKSWTTLPPKLSKPLLETRTHLKTLDADLRRSGKIGAANVHACSAAIVKAALEGQVPTLLEILKQHHNHSYVHSVKASALLTLFGVSLNLQAADLAVLSEGGLLHDIGKVFIDPEILDKADSPSAEEWEILKRHPLESAEIIRRTKGLSERSALVAERHHEWLNGSGYPHGLKGEQIDDLSLITALADTYAALTDQLPYRNRHSPEEALKLMRENSGTQFEPGFLAHFEKMVREKLM